MSTLAVLGELVAFPTESRTPNAALIDWVADRLAAFGGRITRVGGTDTVDRTNLLASFGPSAAGGRRRRHHRRTDPGLRPHDRSAHAR